MLNELAIALLLSICTTALLFIIANIFKKKWKINHPKNTFLIYVIVLLTAASIFPFASIAFSTSQDNINMAEMDILDIKGVPISESTIITENKDITYSSSITSLSDTQIINPKGINLYLQKISWDELIILDEYKTTESKQKIDELSKSNPLNTSQLLQKTLVAFNKDGMNTPDLINQIITNLIINQNSKSKEESASFNIESKNIQDKNENQESFSMASLQDETYFYYGVLFLFFLSFIYVISSIFFRKKHILNNLHASKCKDKQILDLIKSISKEFKIKSPNVYQYEGPPNAFVFGYPINLAFSKELKRYLSDKEFEAAIRHELAHVKNHDILIKPILQGIRIFFFYNPLVHILCLKIMKNREILADISTFTSKKEKISLIEALIKVNKYTKNSYKQSFPAYQIPLISYNPAKLTLTERFSNLFETASKKTVLTILVSCIILLANISIFFVAGTINETYNSSSDESIEHQEFCIDKSYYSESVTYTKVSKNSKTYLAMIVEKNLYNIVSAETDSSELVKDLVQDRFPQENLFIIYQNHEPHF
ncbi:MAG: hypothetical protein DRN27_00155 [Thermoplasmata archaeon]|nr:MAG: hypothetical protein DRN27_00155 [Thermoplasmata archaeon]